VDKQRFEVAYLTYEAAPEAGIVRIYYLPQSKHVVNMEHLADRPLPTGAIESPMATLQQAFSGMRSHDHVQAAEARATLNALGNAEMAILRPTAAAAPQAGQRDPRPLAEAILGTWQLGPIKVRFDAGGTASVVTFDGHTRDGHWSVDSTGRLHANAITGADQVADAWVVGDALTVSVDGQALTAHRVASQG
jgi:hypothetical protein